MHTFTRIAQFAAAAVLLLIGSALPGSPARAVTSVVYGTFSSSNGLIGDGVIYFFASCADYLAFKPAGSNSYLSGGHYSVPVANGTYLARLYPRHGYGAAPSWHATKGSCESADPIFVEGDTNVDLVAQPGFEVSGTVTATDPVSSGRLDFYATCQDFVESDVGGVAYFSGTTYAATLAAGTHWVRVVPDQGSAGLESWNGATRTCEQSTPITVTDAGVYNMTAIPGNVLRGTVGSSNGAITGGEVFFYATCQDYLASTWNARVSIGNGRYTATVANGDYRILVSTGSSGSASPRSWHRAKATCEQSDPVTVAAHADLDIVALERSAATGSVTSAAGPVLTGHVTFHDSCAAAAESGGTSYVGDISEGRYTAHLPNGTYRVFIRPDSASGAKRSWHSAKLACAESDPVVILRDTVVDLVAAKAGTVAPSPTPSASPPVPSPGAQSVKAPPKRLKRGKRVSLPRATEQGAPLGWTTMTRKVCSIKKSRLRATRKGVCRVRATAPRIGDFSAYRGLFTIRVK